MISAIFLTPLNLSCTLIAEGTNIFFTTSSLTQTQNIVNAYLKQLSVWLHINKLQLNAKKNKYIIFKQINKPMAKNITIIFLGTKIERVKTEKFLGMWFQENLSWNTNVEN